MLLLAPVALVIRGALRPWIRPALGIALTLAVLGGPALGKVISLPFLGLRGFQAAFLLGGALWWALAVPAVHDRYTRAALPHSHKHDR